eukprot:CAMPEP_0174300438 /NCGR_PEP_ID=MMETSP0809-20121228/58462_1 /TAXON_ID=73025 ORGANISM="Eutreptiella gymnastica-like, Strain CCMP1594" /NCGR_SAMPLE_ID=MMETSP0809 /ASSEMBLY_ACC=CAM_ASM_000658 /LENGTH=385 /DNA_ID=CAMNT_0015406011 /DNA_START=41 /DNA_END=1198 /DNA_ORIENTATION=+
MSKTIGDIISCHQVDALDWKDPQVIEAFESACNHCRNPDLLDIVRIRTKVQHMITDCLIKKGFVHPPVALFSPCTDPLNHETEVPEMKYYSQVPEMKYYSQKVTLSQSMIFNKMLVSAALFSPCTDPLNHETEVPEMKYYGQKVTLSQSMIFNKMLVSALSNIQKVFWVSPNIRKEMNVKDTGRYATEFTQIDFESTQLDFESCMNLIEEILEVIVNTLAEEEGDVIERISGRRLPKLQRPLKRYDLADEAAKLGCTQGQAEDVLVSQNPNQPFFLTNLKREAYDRREESTGKYKNYDVLFPVVGEILSGAEREHTHERLTMRMHELGYKIEYFEPILRVAKEHGLKSSAGAGFGVERLVRAICLLPSIQAVYPFPRIPEKLIVF